MMNIKSTLFSVILLASPVAAAPIQWQPWSEDLFAQAQREHKLVILDLEAVWCHWCHVMEEKTYSDAHVQQLIGSGYIAVRVDQDSRPDLSNRYEDYGWPATIVFDSKGQELAKRSGFIPPGPLASMLDAFMKDPTPGPSGGADDNYAASNESTLAPGLKKEMEQSFFDTYDPTFGGWGDVHKFLDPDLIEYAMALASQGNTQAQTMARQTLDANLALIDPAWGGVYQYSTDGRWDVPHFEKIMYYQANDLRMYAQAYALWKKPSDLKAAEDIHRFLTGFLLSPEGAFYTSQDADLIQGEHSAAYFKKSDAARRKLGIPKIDQHIYSRENGWAIEALTALYSVTGDKATLQQAQKAADSLLQNRTLENGGFRHDEKDSAGPYLADTLAMARAFLSLYAVTADRSWLAKSQASADYIIANFQNADGGFITSRSTTAGLKPKPQRDENASAARYFNLLNHYTGTESYRKMAEHAMQLLSNPSMATRLPTASVLMTDAELSSDPMHITVLGDKKNSLTQQLFSTALSKYSLTYRRIEVWDRAEGPLPNKDVQYPELDQPAAFVCADGRCSLPLMTVEKLKAKLKIQ